MQRSLPSPVVPDPSITVGKFRVLARTDGKHVAYDESRPLAQRGVFVHVQMKAVIAWCLKSSPPGTVVEGNVPEQAQKTQRSSHYRPEGW